jgi:HAD superfamily hydrolase (TIGR01509 family)
MIRHVIFDCDGVLVDSEPLSMRADVMLLKQHGIEMSEAEAHRRFVGTTFQSMLDMMTKEHGTVFPQGLHEAKNRMVDDLYRRELKIVDGVADLLRVIRGRGIAVSIGSNSPKMRVALAIELTGIGRHFARIISFEDVKNGKPAPDIFVKAAALSGFAPAECLVVEDSITGVTAALASGTKVVGFVGTHAEPEKHAAALKALGVEHVISRMADVIHHL